MLRNPNSKYGFDYRITDENGKSVTRELTTKTSDNYFKLDIDELNIKYLSIKQIQEGINENGVYVIPGREERHSNSKSLIEYATPEEKEIYEELIEKWNQRKKEDSKPLTEKEKLLKQIEKLQAKINKLS